MSEDSINRRCSVELAIEPGEIVVNHAWLVCRSEECALIEIDCGTKYPIPGGDDHGYDGYVAISLMANENSIGIDESRKGNLTTVAFPEFNGWKVFCFDAARYTVRVALAKTD